MAGSDHSDHTNYDEDHVSGYPDLMRNVVVDVLGRNHSVSPRTITDLKSKDGLGPGINTLVQTIQGIFTGGPPPALDNFGDTTFSLFRNDYGMPPFGFDDENNLSLVIFIKCGDHKIIFPGDMEKAGWRRLLWDPAFVQELHGVTLFVASHHGRENGYCPEVMALCPNIRAVVISDKKKGYQSQETVPRYRQHASGIFFPNGNSRRVLTTRRDSSMQFSVPPFGTAYVNLNLVAQAA